MQRTRAAGRRAAPLAGDPGAGDLSLAQLRAFYHVARQLSFSRAAESLHLSQPAISRQVQALEQTLGLRLFSERGRRVELSEAGRALYDYAERILRLCGEAVQTLEELRNLDHGRVALAASTTPGGYLLPALLARFRRRHPGIDVELSVTHSAEALRRVADGEAHLGLVGAAEPAAGLFLYPYAADELVLVCPPDHPLAGSDADGSALSGETLLLREDGSGTRAAVEAHLRATGLRFSATLTLGCSEAIRGAAAAGLGVAFLSRLVVADELARGRLGRISGGQLTIARTFYLAAPKESHLSPASLALRAFLQKQAAADVSIT